MGVGIQCTSVDVFPGKYRDFPVSSGTSQRKLRHGAGFSTGNPARDVASCTEEIKHEMFRFLVCGIKTTRSSPIGHLKEMQQEPRA